MKTLAKWRQTPLLYTSQTVLVKVCMFMPMYTFVCQKCAPLMDIATGSSHTTVEYYKVARCSGYSTDQTSHVSSSWHDLLSTALYRIWPPSFSASRHLSVHTVNPDMPQFVPVRNQTLQEITVIINGQKAHTLEYYDNYWYWMHLKNAAVQNVPAKFCIRLPDSFEKPH